MKKQSILWLGLFSLLGLVACNNGGNTSSESSSEDSSSSSEYVDPTDYNAITNSDLSKGVTTYTDADGNTKNLTRSSIYAASGDPHVNSAPEKDEEGNFKKQKLLVAPISFVYNADDDNDTICVEEVKTGEGSAQTVKKQRSAEQMEDLRVKIDKTFTADDDELYELSKARITSVQSYYNTSSFNKGGFDVVVLPCWVEYTTTAKAFENVYKNSGAGVTMSSYVKNWYKAEYAKTDHGQLGKDWEYTWSDFDSDDDGYIDLLWQVYAYPYNNSDTSFWWAYVTYTTNQANVDDPSVKTLAWASTQFMSKYKGYDPHTFIHETGHTYGANDYYDYTHSWSPMGKVDMQDNNVGDQNAYTKFQFGWINPWVLKESDLQGNKGATITLRASTLSGDALVLASPNYNGTAFDEYLIVELVGPYGLAKRDYNNGYEGVTGYKKPGIRVLHIDARMFKASHDTYVSDPNELGRKGGDHRVSNTKGGRVGVHSDSDYWPITTSSGLEEYRYYTECSLIESNLGETWMNSSSGASYNAATNGTLFTEGHVFQMSPTSSFATHFFPSKTNLWNKAKTITGWKTTGKTEKQEYTVDNSITCNYKFTVDSIVTDNTYGAVATIKVGLTTNTAA